MKQVESDIASYKGLLMGLFFMTVGMEISVGLFFARYRTVLAAMAVLIAGKARPPRPGPEPRPPHLPYRRCSTSHVPSKALLGWVGVIK